MGGMAVLIASDLSKDMAGNPLLRGVSFKLERRDRLTIAGRNGAGKTTLLRMLAGETSVDGGELAFEKGCKVALHDQRPPRDRDLTLRDYILGGCARARSRSRPTCRAWRRRWPTATRRRSTHYSRAEARLEHAGGWTWRDRATAMVRGLGFDDADLDRQLKTFSGGELTRASLARALAGDPDLLLLDEPTNHLDIESLEWLEKTLLVARRGDRARRPRPLVPRGRRHRGARARGRPLALLPRHVDAVAQGAGRARDRARPRDRQAAGRDRAPGELRRALPREGDEGQAGAVARQGAGQDRAHRARPARPRAGVRLQGARALGARRLRADRTGASRSAPTRRGCCSTAPRSGSSAASTSRSSAPNGAGKTTLIDTLAGVRPLAGGQARARPQREDRPPLPARRRARGPAARAPCSRRASCTPG